VAEHDLDSQNARKQRAVVALLSESTQAAAAAKANVSARTIRRWLAEDGEFRADYREARRQLVEEAVKDIQKACVAATRTLREVMSDTAAPSSARIGAARIVLTVAIEAVERDSLMSRIDELERRLSSVS